MKRYDVVVSRIDATHIEVEYKPSEYGMWVKWQDAEADISKLRRCGNCLKWNPLNQECYDNAAYDTYITERNHTCEKWELQP
jgi:hypothetical protein